MVGRVSIEVQEGGCAGVSIDGVNNVEDVWGVVGPAQDGISGVPV